MLRAAAATAVLVICAVALAAAGERLVPGADPGAPGWLLGPYGQGLGLAPGLFLGLLYLATLAWAALVATARHLGARVLWALVGALVALFALAPPLLSLDVFSYISYGRLSTEAGLNPYEAAPADLPGDPAADRVDHFSDAVSVYGPLFTLLSYPLAALGVPAALWSLKAIAALSVLALAALTARIAALRGVPPGPASAFVALNPLVLVHVVGGAHNDGLMVALALGGVLAALTARPAVAGLALVASVGLKAAGALYLPFALAGAQGRRRLLAAAALAAAALAAPALAIFGGSVVEALGVAGDNQATSSRWSVPGALAGLLGVGVDPLRIGFAAAYAGLVVALLAAVIARGADWVRAAGWAAFGLLVATAWMVPWYVIWLLPLAAVARDRALVAATVALTLFQVIHGVPV